MARARRTVNPNPIARSGLASLTAGVNRDALSLRDQVKAAEGLVRKARRRGGVMTLESALADIAHAQITRQRNQLAAGVPVPSRLR